MPRSCAGSIKRSWPKQEEDEEDKKGTKKDANKPKYYCRHHIQGDLSVQLNKSVVSLDELHTPTGYVAIEDIIRFCTEDLEVEYRYQSKRWHKDLEDSYKQFRVEFAPLENWDGEN